MQQEELDFVDGENKLKQLYVCWCVKEAVYKCYGQKEAAFADQRYFVNAI